MDEKRIEAAAKELVNALDRCADVINGAFKFAAFHGFDYTVGGKLTYGKELDALKQALAGEGEQASPVPEAQGVDLHSSICRCDNCTAKFVAAKAREHDRMTVEEPLIKKGPCIAFDASGKELAWLVEGNHEFVITTIKGH